MTLKVQISSFNSPDNMRIHTRTVDAVNRPCMVGEEDQPILLVKNGNLEFSYSPRHDHYWFSRCPDNGWFSRYYNDEWANPAQVSGLAAIKKTVKNYLRPAYRSMRSLLGIRSRLERYGQYDIQDYFSILAPYARPGSKIMEAGCGLAEYLVPFKRAGFTCLGIEPSRVWARTARQNGIDVLESMIQDTPEVRAMFAQSDIVFSNHSMEHHWDPRLLLSLARDNMQPGSILSITVPNAESTFWLFQSLFLLHLDVYTVRSLESLLASYGFRCFYQSQSHQLRVVAVREPDVKPLAPRGDFDEAGFRVKFLERFAAQIHAAPDEIGSGQDFAIGFRGSRPFFRFDYEVYPQSEPVTDTRFIAGRLAQVGEQNAILVFDAPVGASYMALK